jgi:hypothetical protein
MKKLFVSIALIAFVSAMAVPSIKASDNKPVTQQASKVTAKKDDKSCNKSCTKASGSCCKNKSNAKSTSPGKTDKK